MSKSQRNLTTQLEQRVGRKFDLDTAHHELTVIRDDGLYRHLRARQPETILVDGEAKQGHSWYWFDIVTWPGYLTIVGDYGEAYIFHREPDMLRWFASPVEPGRINPHYWGQKVSSNPASVKVYSPAAMRRCIQESVDAAIADGEWPVELREAAVEELITDPYALEHRDTAWNAVERFRFECVPPDQAHLPKWKQEPRVFAFDDAWEWETGEYEQSFLWACYAIAWAVARYWADRPATPAKPVGRVVDLVAAVGAL